MTLLEAVFVEELLIALTLAAVMAGLLAVARRNRVTQMGGPFVVAAAFVSLVVTGSMPVFVGIGLFGLLFGGWLWNHSRWIAVTVVLASSWPIIEASPMGGRNLFQASAVVYVLFVGWSMIHFEGRRGPVVTILLVVSLIGVYLTVPSPDEAAALVGASLIFAIRPGIAPTASFAMAGLLVWTAVLGGADRTGSIVGALAGIGILAMEPIGNVLGPRIPAFLRLLDAKKLTPRLLFTIQLLVVTITSRVAGFRSESEPAFVVAILAWAIGWSLMAFDLDWSYVKTPASISIGDEDE